MLYTALEYIALEVIILTAEHSFEQYPFRTQFGCFGGINKSTSVLIPVVKVAASYFRGAS